MLSHAKLSILLLTIELVISEGSRHNWYKHNKRSKSPIKQENWPLLVTLQMEHPTNLCDFFGGMILNKNWVLTSAMACKNSTPKNYFVVRSNLLKKNDIDARGYTTLYSKDHITYPEFHIRKFFTARIPFNDICLLRLATELPYRELPQLQLPIQQAKTDTKCKTVAWKQLYAWEIYEDEERVVSIDECKKLLTESFGTVQVTIGHMHFCTKSSETRSGLMALGQPLMCNNKQYGIASLPNFHANYSLWTRTDEYVSWIKEIIPEDDDESLSAFLSNDYGFLRDYG